MLNRRGILAALSGLAIFVAATLPLGGVLAAGLEGRAEQFIRSLSDQAVESLTKKDVPREQRINSFRELFNDHFAVRSIGRFVLGSHWRKATDEEKKEYMDLFEDLMVVSYVDRFQSFAGENLNITKSRADKANTATVFSQFSRANAAKPVQVLWRVGASGETIKILDVIVEGVSMSLTLRSDFGSIIRLKGGRISGLLEELRVKTASLKAEAGN